MGWVRFFAPPRICGYTEGRTPRERYKYQQAKARYDASENGKYMKELGHGLFMQGEIGRYEGIRIITST